MKPFADIENFFNKKINSNHFEEKQLPVFQFQRMKFFHFST